MKNELLIISAETELEKKVEENFIKIYTSVLLREKEVEKTLKSLKNKLKLLQEVDIYELYNNPHLIPC